MTRWGKPTKNKRKRNPRYHLNEADDRAFGQHGLYKWAEVNVAEGAVYPHEPESMEYIVNESNRVSSDDHGGGEIGIIIHDPAGAERQSLEIEPGSAEYRIMSSAAYDRQGDYTAESGWLPATSHPEFIRIQQRKESVKQDMDSRGPQPGGWAAEPNPADLYESKWKGFIK